MSKEIEIEVKVLLNYKSYVKLIRHFNLENSTPIIHTNYYFDTPDLTLSNLKAALRIRQLDNNYTLTLKTNLGEGRLETIDTVSKHFFDNFIAQKAVLEKGDVYSKLTELKIDPKTLNYVDCLTTKRYQFNYQENDQVLGTICIDCNTYGDYVDYELEFEGTSIEESKKIVSRIMDTIGLPFAFTELSKIERVYNAIITK